jgi:hypothetical protein
MIGGTTYGEARVVEEINANSSSVGDNVNPSHARILLGGTCIHNSSSYLDMVRYSATSSFPPSVFDPPPESATTAPSLNLTLGGVNVRLGGSDSGVYRAAEGEREGVDIQGVEGVRDGIVNLFGKVRQGVEGLSNTPL